ncbi:MAG: MnhB domain-containing protein [Campylobacterota bacterium]|nr:MnhB domain-containing protein [Campylobacterota bacterium]
MSLKRSLRVQTLLVSLLVSLMSIVLLGVLLHTPHSAMTLGKELLEINSAATQSANAVTSVVTYFRGLDTLGEVSILFLSIFGLSLGIKKHERNIFSFDNALLKIGTKVLFPLILLFGIYIILHGHLSPGGGFQGGVIIASGFLLLFLTHGDDYHLSERIIKLVEALSGAGFILVGVLGLIVTGRFFENFLPLGEIGTLFSGGVLEIIYIFVGLKVAAEIAAMAELFIKAEHA